MGLVLPFVPTLRAPLSPSFSLSPPEKKKNGNKFSDGGNGHFSMHINSLLVHGTQVYTEAITDHLLTLTYTPYLV